MGASLSYPPDGGGGSQPPGLGPRYASSHTLLSPPDPTAPTVTPRDKKKKMPKFATLRKKLCRVRRHSRSLDQTRALRELTSNWSIRELSSLLDEYDANKLLKELTLQASLSRSHANSVKDDLSLLYDYKYCTDVDLVYAGVVFPVHRAIVSVRCAYLRELLLRYPDFGSQVAVTVRTAGVDSTMFSALLRYLYTGELRPPLSGARLLVRKLADEFGLPNPVEHDLRNLLETGMFSDALLIFTDSESSSAAAGGAGRRLPKHELRCHKAVLAARSPFFRNLLLRRARAGDELTERALHSPTCIVLDESVIPRRYARVLLHAIYLDSVDLSCIVRSSLSMCSLSDVHAMVAAPKAHASMLDEAMEIYQIGQFLDFPVLSQGCEDLILDKLSVDTLVPILQWSEEDHGSASVHRQAVHFLHEEFLNIAHSPILHELSHAYMLNAVKSDFLQAGEVEVLGAVLRWGEHQLMKRMEEREPNLLSHTAHSVSKKGVRKRDLSDSELKDILAELLPHLRTDHIIPPNNDLLNSAIKRGLISVPPSHMIGDDSHSTASAWIRVINNGMYFKPRLFMPYYEEVKGLLEEQLAQENEVVRLRTLRMSPFPDTLYMVDDKSYCMHTVAASVDVIAATIPVPSPSVQQSMVRREAELQLLAQDGYRLPCVDRAAITHQIQLRVVREFGLPDSAVELLWQHHTCPAAPRPEIRPVRRVRPRCFHQQPASPPHHVCPSAAPPMQKDNRSEASGACSGGAAAAGELMMPDIALATASVHQMSLQEATELDLGDGSHHAALFI